MMIKIDDGSWVESEDIKISERDKFLWWWVDYLCYSVDIKKKSTSYPSSNINLCNVAEEECYQIH